MSLEPGVVAVVPLRDGVSGKSRLAAGLTPAARRRLVAQLAQHVVATLRATPEVDEVLVVTADPAFAREVVPGVAVLAEPPGLGGLNAALDLARDAVRRRAPRATLLVAHADLPALAPEDVTALLAEAGPARAADVVVATDRHGTGTNLLALPASAAYAFRFGPGSRAAHEAEAAAEGLRAAVVERPGTAADLDTLDDWADLPPATREALTA